MANEMSQIELARLEAQSPAVRGTRLRAPADQHRVTLLAVYADGSVLAQQDNRPRIAIGTQESTRWTWKVVSVEGFSGAPQFWTSHANPDDTTRADLFWSGIDNQDWQFGREGKVVIEALPTKNARTKRTLTVQVAIRSIDQKDLTFFAPGVVHRVTACKAAAWDRKRQYTFKLAPPAPVDGYPYPLVTSTSSGTSFDVQLLPGGHFDAPKDSWLDLTVIDGPSRSHLRMRADTRPLKVTDTGAIFGAAPLSFVQGRPIALEILGAASTTAGYAWELKDPDLSRFKGTPAFKSLGRGDSASLALDGLSDWDWINGTAGSATLSVQDGRRQAAEMPFEFALEQVARRFSLTEGTELKASSGQRFTVAEDGEYAPVIDRTDPDAPVIRLEGVWIRAVTAGAASNLAADAALELSSKLPMLGTATVSPDGLNLGDDLETDGELRDRVRVLWAAPPAHGNRSHVLKIAEQVAGVDRAFLYPPIALDGAAGLGKVGCALVAPGPRPGVGRTSALALEVREQLVVNGSLTADYVMMDVDQVGKVDPGTGKGDCEVDVEVQLRLADETGWGWAGAQNAVIGSAPDSRTLVIFSEAASPERTAEVDALLADLTDGSTVYVLGRVAKVEAIDNPRRTLYLAAPLVDEDGVEIPADQIVGQRVYPACPIRSRVETELAAIFKELGTSRARPPGNDLPAQERFPLPSFRNPDQLRIAEIVSRLMDLDGVVDLRVVAPSSNVAPPFNETIVLGSGERVHKAFILSLRRVVLGPLRPTPGVDAAYAGPSIGATE